MDIKSKLFYTMAFGIIFIVEFGTASILSFNLEQAQYNTYQQIINILPFAISIISLGAPFSIVYFTSSGFKTKKYLYDANLSSFYAAITLIILSIFLFIFSPDLLCITIAITLGFFGAVKQNTISFFLGKKELNLAAKIRIYQRTLALAPVIIGALTMSYIDNIYLIFLLISGEIIGFIALQKKYKVVTTQVRVKYLKRLRVTSYFSFLTNSISMLMSAAPLLIVSFFQDNEKVKIEFAISIMMIRYATLMLGPFMQLIVPSISSIKKNKGKVDQWFKKNISIVIFIGLMFLLLVQIFAEYFIGFFFSKDYKDTSNYLMLLSFTIPFLVMNSFLAATLSALGKIKIVFKTTLITFFILIITGITVMNTTKSIEFFSLSIILSYLISTTIYYYEYLKWK